MSLIVLTNERSADSLIDWAVGVRSHVEIVPVSVWPKSNHFRWKDPKFTRLEHVLWSKRASRALSLLSRKNSVAWAHHVTFATEVLAPPFRRRHRFPRVWGPIGAGGNRRVFSVSPCSRRAKLEMVAQFLRDVVSGVLFAWNRRNSDLILAQNSQLKPGPRTQLEVFPNVIVPPHDFIRGPEAARAQTILVVGHYIPRKRPELALDVLLDPRLADWSLHFVGPGGTSGYVEVASAAAELGLNARVTHHGLLGRYEVLELMSKSAVLFHPSAREGASGVVGEAASVGLPVVCFDSTGASSVLLDGDSAGVLVPPRRGSMRSDLATAILQAAELPSEPTDWSAERIQTLIEGIARRVKS